MIPHSLSFNDIRVYLRTKYIIRYYQLTSMSLDINYNNFHSEIVFSISIARKRLNLSHHKTM